MLNRVILMGRITHDLELKQTQNGIPVLSFQIAVDRSFTRQGEEKQSDFIRCVAWRQTAEFISRYFYKGRLIALEGQLRTSTFDDRNGVKQNRVEVYIDNASFCGEPKQQGNNGGYGNNNYGNNNGGYGGYNNNTYGGNYGQQGGGYQQSGGYQQGGGYNSGYGSQPAAPAPASNAPAANAPQPDDQVNIGDFQDFEVFSDDGVPF